VGGPTLGCLPSSAPARIDVAGGVLRDSPLQEPDDQRRARDPLAGGDPRQLCLEPPGQPKGDQGVSAGGGAGHAADRRGFGITETWDSPDTCGRCGAHCCHWGIRDLMEGKRKVVPIESLAGLRDMTLTAVEQLAALVGWDPFALLAALAGTLEQRAEVDPERLSQPLDERDGHLPLSFEVAVQ
jgi:hypothetical protein